MKNDNSINKLTEKVIGCALAVHKELGPGLLESTYKFCLAEELKTSGIAFKTEVEIPVNYKNKVIDCGYRFDCLRENRLIVELKSVSEITDIHKAQVLTYMKLAGVPLGLLINFNVRLLKNGIQRFIF